MSDMSAQHRISSSRNTEIIIWKNTEMDETCIFSLITGIFRFIKEPYYAEEEIWHLFVDIL